MIMFCRDIRTFNLERLIMEIHIFVPTAILIGSMVTFLFLMIDKFMVIQTVIAMMPVIVLWMAAFMSFYRFQKYVGGYGRWWMIFKKNGYSVVDSESLAREVIEWVQNNINHNDYCTLAGTYKEIIFAFKDKETEMVFKLMFSEKIINYERH